ncbi:MAG: TolC family protein [Acidobacteria bacterium]|nr:TolC family protein [Acidobacteriota bacterium]
MSLNFKPALVARSALVALALVLMSSFARAQSASPTPAPRATPAPQATPGTPQPSPTVLPPNAPGSTVRPSNEAQQSAQPATVGQQQQQQTQAPTQGPTPVTPRPTGVTPPGSGLPSSATPVGTSAPQTPNPNAQPAGAATGVGQVPGQNVGASTGVAPAELPQEPPPVAPDFRAPARPLPSAERVGVDVTNQAPLTLNDAIRMALKNSNDIDESRVDVAVAEYNLRAARGVYDPLFSSESFYDRATTPTSSTIGGGGARGSVTQTDETGTARLGGYSPKAGGAYELDFSSTRLVTTNQNVTLNPQYPAALTFTYTQPLFRGRSFDNNRRQIEIAKKNLSLTDAQFRQRAIDVISQVEQAYWDLVFSLRNLQVQIDAVKQARLQVESNQRMVAQGVLAPIEIVAAQTQVTTFEQNVYTAQAAVTTAENTLKTLILPDRLDPLWSRALTPVTPVNLEAPRVAVETAVQAALTSRPDLAQLRTSADINDVNTRFFREQTKPQVDLVGTYTSAGLAGTFVPRTTTATGTTATLLDRVNELSTIEGLPPIGATTTTTSVAPQLIGGYGQSLQNLIDQRYPTLRLGVRVSIPLRNRTAEANLGSSLAQGTRIKDQVRQAEQLVEADVRNSLQAVRSAEARLQSAAATRSSAEQQYESQQRQLRAGTTTVFLVLQAQQTLLAAQGAELQAQTDLNKAISRLQHSTGNTLNANNVAVRTDTRDLEMRADTNAAADGDSSATNPANAKPATNDAKASATKATTTDSNNNLP